MMVFFQGVVKELKKISRVKAVKYDKRPTFTQDRYIVFQVDSLDSKEYQLYFSRNGTVLKLVNYINNESFHFNLSSEDIDSRMIQHWVKLVIHQIKYVFGIR